MFRAGVRGQTTTADDPVRTGGASANGVGVSWLLRANAAANTAPTAAMPLASPWIFKNNAATGGAITLTMHALANKAAKPDSNMMWAQASYMGAAGSARWNKAAPNAPPALPAVSPAAGTADSVSAWDSATPARADTAAYSLGDTIKVASNPGRVFFCITPGTTAGSEPAGYATAVDGDVVTDNTADFRAGWRLSFAVSVTPQVEGLVGMRAYLVDSEAAPTAVYVDPTITVS
jgi:hypothetical protein